MSRTINTRIVGQLAAMVGLVVLAMSGSAVAASLITSKQIKDGTIQLKDISKTTRAKLKGNAGPQGAHGAQGPKGDRGEPGPATGAAGGVLSGNYPNPRLAPAFDRLTPVALFVVDGGSGNVISEAHRAPVRDAPAGEKFAVGGYKVTLPSMTFFTNQDVANCTTSNGLSVAIGSVGGALVINTEDHTGAPANTGRLRCVVYDVVGDEVL